MVACPCAAQDPASTLRPPRSARLTGRCGQSSCISRFLLIGPGRAAAAQEREPGNRVAPVSRTTGSICPAAPVMPRRGSQFVVVGCLRQVVEDVHDRFPSRGRHRGQTAFRTDDERRIARWTHPARPIRTGGQPGERTGDRGQQPRRGDGRGSIPRGIGQIVASLIAMTGECDLARMRPRRVYPGLAGAGPRRRAGPPRDLAHYGSPQPGCRRAANGHGMRSHAQPLTPAREAINATAAR